MKGEVEKNPRILPTCLFLMDIIVFLPPNPLLVNMVV